jgi:uncharacterized protein
MITISNATPLIGLASIGRFDLLRQIFGEIIIPQAVFDETVMRGREAGGAKREVSSANWIKVVSIKDRLAVEVLLDVIDIGEAETIVLSRELNADWVLMDEKKGRRKLTELGLPKIGTLGILLKAKQANLIPVIQPEILKLRQNSLSLSQQVIDSVLRQAGE